MNFRTYVEPLEPMRGLEIPPEVVEALGGGKRPAVTITINGHSWKSRVAIMRGRYLLGLSTANRQAAGVVTGDEVEVDVELDTEPRVVAEPADFARALDASCQASPDSWPNFARIADYLRQPASSAAWIAARRLSCSVRRGRPCRPAGSAPGAVCAVAMAPPAGGRLWAPADVGAAALYHRLSGPPEGSR